MKRALLLGLVLFAFTTLTFAQTPVQDNTAKYLPDKCRFDPQLHKDILKAKNEKATRSRWYNFAYTMDDILGYSFFNWNNLFPDTSILVDYGTSGYSGPWIHMLANSLDPSSDWFNDPNQYPIAQYLNITPYMPYTVDSVSVNIYYWRMHPDPTIVDTLVIEVYNTNTTSNFQQYYFGPASSTAANYGTDTVRFGAVLFHASTLASKATNVKTYKVPLTEAMANDTLDDGSIMVSVGTSEVPGVNANQNVVATYKFIPGYTWIPNVDTLFNMNVCRFVSYEEMGEGTWSNYTKRDWNCSYLARDICVFYDSANAGWFEWQIPEWAFTSATYGYENHVVSYLLTANETGIDQPAGNIIGLGQNQPNPFSDFTTVRYTLEEAAEVTFELFDQVGRKVMTINRGMETPGKHAVEIDATKLNNGIYFYSIIAGGQKASRKMVIQR